MATVNVNEKVLIRFFNAGLRSHAPQVQNLYMTVHAEDGSAYKYPSQRYCLTLPALKTKDVIIKPPADGEYAVCDRALSLTNAKTSPGGMLVFIQVAP